MFIVLLLLLINFIYYKVVFLFDKYKKDVKVLGQRDKNKD